MTVSPVRSESGHSQACVWGGLRETPLLDVFISLILCFFSVVCFCFIDSVLVFFLPICYFGVLFSFVTELPGLSSTDSRSLSFFFM